MPHAGLDRGRRRAAWAGLLAGALFAAALAAPAQAQEGLLLYVPNFNTNTVTVLQTGGDGSATAQTTFGGVGNSILATTVRPDQAYAYVPSRGTSQLFVVDTRTNSIVQTLATGAQPSHLAFSPDGRRAYLANNGSTVGVYDVDALSGQLTSVTNIATGGGSGSRAAVVSPDGRRVYAADQQLDRVIVIDASTNSVLTTVTVGDQPLSIATNPDGSRLYVSNFTDDTVSIIDTSTNSVVATIGLDFGGTNGRGPDGVAVGADGRYLYVANRTTGNVSIVDTNTNSTVGIVTAGPSTNGVVVSPDGTTLYVTSQGASDRVNFFTIDGSTGLLTANGTVAVGDSPVRLGMCSNGSGLLASGATFLARTGAALGCAGTTASFTGGSLVIGGSDLRITTPMTLGSAGGTIDTNGNDATLSGGITGTGSLTKTGSGALVLAGTNSYSGATLVQAGTLRAGAADAFSPNSAMTVSAGAVLDLAGFDQTVGSLAGSGEVTLGAGTLTAGGDGTTTTFSGSIGGSGGLTKTGAGSLTLAGSNRYTGATLVSDGTLVAGRTDSFAADSATTVAEGAELDLAGFDQTVGSLAGAGLVSLGSATLTAGGDGSSTTFSGSIAGSGGLTKAGGGMLTLNGINGFLGTAEVSGGTLAIGDAEHPGARLAGDASVGSGARLIGHGTVGGALLN